MERSEIAERIKNVTAEVLEIDAASIKESDKFTADLGAESFQSVELVAAFEEEFDIEMDSDKALSIQTVGDAIEFIKQYVDEK
jgi:acyl carrier protein